jgi:farnesyl diphosphate synthase
MSPPVLAPIGPAFAEAASFTEATLDALGPERVRAQAEALVRQAASHLDLFDEKADLLRAAARFVIMRKA